MSSLNLICLPYAGGNMYSYDFFQKYFKGKLNVITPELPGRGEYYGQPLLTDIQEMADVTFNKLYRYFLNGPYAFYGHSMGGLLAFLIARRIADEKLPAPTHFFCSGCEGPSVPSTDEYHKLPHDGFIARLREFGGSPDEILSHKELMDFYLPVIRSDFEAFETYRHRPGVPFSFPVTVFIGDNDIVTHEEAEAWRKETTGPGNIITFPGNHFFIQEHAAEISSLILDGVAATE